MSESGGTIDLLECRTYEPNAPKWTSVGDVAKALGMRAKRLYGWVYQGKIQGAKKGNGQLLIPAAEMTRLVELQKEGRLDEVMWHEPQKAGREAGGKRRAAGKVVTTAKESAAGRSEGVPVRKTAEKRREAVLTALRVATEARVTPEQQERDLRQLAAEYVARYNAGLLPETEHERHLVLLTRGEVAELVRWSIAAQVVADKAGMRVMVV